MLNRLYIPYDFLLTGTMNRITPFILSLIIILTLETCRTSGNELHPVNNIDSAKIIYLVNHGWHAGIVLKWTDIPAPPLAGKQGLLQCQIS